MATTVIETVSGIAFADGSVVSGTYTVTYGSAGNMATVTNVNLTATKGGVQTVFTTGAVAGGQADGPDYQALFTSGSSKLYLDWVGENPSQISTGTIAGAGSTLIHSSILIAPAASSSPVQTGGTVTCFLAGTHILSDRDEILVEDLKVGDMILVSAEHSDGVRTDPSGADSVASSPHGGKRFRAITWIGRGAIDVGKSSDQSAAYPVRIRIGAFGENVPHRDLLITPEHCILVDGKLVPARMLVNGGSIIVDKNITRFEYFHIELENHAIVLAEGLETESYLDTGNRASFASGDTLALLPGLAVKAARKSWERHAAAPLAVDRETVEPIWHRLADRSRQIGLDCVYPAANPSMGADLRLVTEAGLEIRPTLVDGKVYAFVAPGDTQELRLLSRSSRPFDTVGPFLDDRRELGVLIGQIGLRVGRQRQAVDTHLGQSALSGWHTPEGAPPFCRWTDGNAILPVDLSAANGTPIFLDIEVIDAAFSGSFSPGVAAAAISA